MQTEIEIQEVKITEPALDQDIPGPDDDEEDEDEDEDDEAPDVD
jgi:hypothetical protein